MFRSHIQSTQQHTHNTHLHSMSWALVPEGRDARRHHAQAVGILSRQVEESRLEDVYRGMAQRRPDGGVWPATSRGRSTYQWPIVVAPNINNSMATYQNTLSGETLRFVMQAERTYSQWPNDLKSRWPRIRADMETAISALMEAMKSLAGQVELTLQRELTAYDERIAEHTRSYTNPYDLPIMYSSNGSNDLRFIADNFMLSVTDVDRAWVQDLLNEAAVIIRELRNRANELQMAAAEAREAASQHIRINPTGAMYGWYGAYQSLVAAKIIMRDVGTAPRAPPYVRARLPYKRTPRQRDDVYATPAQQSADYIPLLQGETPAQQTARVLRSLRVGIEYPMVPLPAGGHTAMEYANPDIMEYSRNPQINPSASGDFDPTAWLQRRVKIPRVPKVAGAAAADFDPTAWLQRRVKIPRQSPKAAQ